MSASAAARRLAYLYKLANHPKTSPAEATAARQAVERILAKHPALTNDAQVTTPDGAQRIPTTPDGRPVFFGKNYLNGRDVAEIAKLIRAQIKQQRKAARLHPDSDGALALVDPIGDAPKDMKFSVRIDRFSGGCSLDIGLVNVPDDWWETYTDPQWGDEMTRPTAQLKTLATECRQLLDSYNRDGSDIASDYWDVAFYSSVHQRGRLLA